MSVPVICIADERPFWFVLNWLICWVILLSFVFKLFFFFFWKFTSFINFKHSQHLFSTILAMIIISETMFLLQLTADVLADHAQAKI